MILTTLQIRNGNRYARVILDAIYAMDGCMVKVMGV